MNTDFITLNDYNLSDFQTAQEAVEHILHPLEEATPEKVVKVQKEILAKEIKNRNRDLVIQNKKIKDLKIKLDLYQKKVAKLDNQINHLEYQRNSKNSEKLQKLQQQRTAIEAMANSTNNQLMALKKDWEIVNLCLTNLGQAAHLSVQDKRMTKVILELNKTQKKLDAELKTVHQNPQDWSFLMDIQQRVRDIQSRSIFDRILGKSGPTATEILKLKMDRRALSDFLKRDDLEPEVKTYAAQLTETVKKFL